MPTLSLERVLREIKQLPSLAAVVMQILHSFENTELDIAVLARQISQDQGLSARVLRVANSAFYGFSGKIGSINEAVVVLGFHNIRSLVSAAGIIDRLNVVSEHFDCRQFWQHNIGTGVGAKILAKTIGQDPEIAFTAGLLHDIGILVLLLYFPDEFKAVLACRRQRDCDLIEAERQVLDMDHARIGAEVAKHWKFPAAIQKAIQHHHDPDRDPQALTDCVHLADVLGLALELGAGPDARVPAMSRGAWERLGLDWDELKSLLPDIERLNASASLLIA